MRAPVTRVRTRRLQVALSMCGARNASSERSGGGRRLAPLVGIALCAVLALIPTRASAAPTPFLLTFQGAHVVDSNLSSGLRHEGRFTASAPFCSAGRAYDVRDLNETFELTLLRLHTCDDGSGSFTALMPAVRGEHGGSGTWKIVEGTGRYATLRGMGTYTGTLISGQPDVFETITYRTSWQGVVDFDAEPPAIEKFTTTARKLRQPPRTYGLRIALTLRDPGAPVSYTLDVRAGRAALGFKRGSMPSGEATITLRIRPPRAARSARILLTAQDAVGNETSASLAVSLR
jgi:hypothetical protein